MGCRCGYNVYIKIYHLVSLCLEIPLPSTLQNLFHRTLQLLLYSCLFSFPSFSNLYITTQITSDRVAFIATSVKINPPFCSTNPLDNAASSQDNTLTTVFCVAELFAHGFITNVTKTIPWHPSYAFSIIYASTISKHQTSALISEEWLHISLLFVL